MEQVWVDLNKVREDLLLDFEEDNDRKHQQPYTYVSNYDEKIENYEGDEDWIEPWDKV